MWATSNVQTPSGVLGGVYTSDTASVAASAWLTGTDPHRCWQISLGPGFQACISVNKFVIYEYI